MRTFDVIGNCKESNQHVLLASNVPQYKLGYLLAEIMSETHYSVIIHSHPTWWKDLNPYPTREFDEHSL